MTTPPDDPTLDGTAPRLAAHKQAVRDFYDAFYNGKDFASARAMLVEDFVNHHPGVPVGRDNTIEQFRVQATEPHPDLFIEITRMVAEGDLVWVHSLVHHGDAGAVGGTIDMWRFAGDLLAEHWDVGLLPLELSREV